VLTLSQLAVQKLNVLAKGEVGQAMDTTLGARLQWHFM
jgi:hypothetical protein